MQLPSDHETSDSSDEESVASPTETRELYEVMVSGWPTHFSTKDVRDTLPKSLGKPWVRSVLLLLFSEKIHAQAFSDRLNSGPLTIPPLDFWPEVITYPLDSDQRAPVLRTVRPEPPPPACGAKLWQLVVAGFPSYGVQDWRRYFAATMSSEDSPDVKPAFLIGFPTEIEATTFTKAFHGGSAGTEKYKVFCGRYGVSRC